MRKNRSLFTDAKPRRTGALVYPMLLILLLAVIVALNFVNNGRVKLLNEDVTITSLSKDLEKFRILHISDLHGNEYGANQSTISTMLKTARYNAVCITGDVCAPDGNYDAFLKLIDVFAGRVPVYFVAGDEDPAPIAAQPNTPERVKADYVLAAEEHGAIYLDSPQKLTVGKSAVWFCPESMYGLDIDSSRAAYQARRTALVNQPQNTQEQAAQLQVINYQLAVLDQIDAAMKEMQDSDVQIALTHHPLTETTIKTLQQWSGSEENAFLRSVSLVLAGHYCGGQVRVPFAGALKAPDSANISGWFPQDNLIQGLSTIQGVTQYISPGLGVSDAYPIPLRMFNTPSITILTLTSVLKF